MGSTLLLIERTTIDPKYLWVITGRGDCEKSGTSRQHKGDLPRFGLQRCVKPYDPALVDVLVFLGSRTSSRCREVRKSRILLPYAMASFYRPKGLPQWHIGGGKVLQRCELIAHITGQDAFNARLRCPFALSGTGARPVPSVVPPPCFDTRPGQ